MIFSDLELAALQTAALFVHDARGRLVRLNEPDPDQPAPRFFLARTLTGNLWRTRHDLPDDLRYALDQLAAREPVSTDLRPPADYAADYAALLQQHAPLTNTQAGPAYYLPPSDPPRDTVTITPATAPLLAAHYPFTQSHYTELAPVVVCVADSAAVAVCCSARSSPHVAEAGVHTVEAYRGRGYAPDTARGWVAGIRAGGRMPLYSTTWENMASQAVALKLGAVQYAVELSLT